MSTNIYDWFEKLENMIISEDMEEPDRDLMDHLNDLSMTVDDEIAEKSNVLSVFYELWDWCIGGIDDYIDKETIGKVTRALRDYGSDELAEQYISAGNELMPFLAKEPSERDYGIINELSNKYNEFVDTHTVQICIAIKKYLLANRDEICETLADVCIYEFVLSDEERAYLQDLIKKQSE